MKVRMTAAMAALVATAAVGFSGCTQTEAGEGLARVETGWMRIDIPEGWVEAEVGAPWGGGYADAAGDDATALLAIAPEYGSGVSALEAQSTILAEAQVGGYPDFRVVEPSDSAEETDLEHRSQIRFTYTGASGDPYDGVLWAVADDAHAVVAQLTGPDLDEALVESIGESIEVIGG